MEGLARIFPRTFERPMALSAMATIALVIAAIGAATSLMHSSPSLWLILVVWLAAWTVVLCLVAIGTSRAQTMHGWSWLVPLIFGATLVFLWQSLTAYFQVPRVILPPPSAIVLRLYLSSDLMLADLLQTSRAIGFGLGVGCLIAIIVAILMDRIPFLQRGLLPYGTLASSLPIVGIAPIMVSWFGFDWPSKAAVVIIMVFFPMLVSMSAGLQATSAIENDLLKTYGASYWQTMVRLRLPASLPFLFNGLKICATLALIGAIVAEFFGTPIVGMGFRINSEVGRMNIDFVWATILVASVLGSVLIWVMTLVEKRLTFWHSSMR